MTKQQAEEAVKLLRPYIKSHTLGGRPIDKTRHYLVVQFHNGMSKRFNEVQVIERWVLKKYSTAQTLTVEQMSLLCGMSTSRIHEVVKKEGAPVEYLGYMRVIPRQQFLDWMDNRKASPIGRKPIRSPK